MCILQLHCRYLELHKTGQLVILAAEKLQSSGAEEGVGQAEVFQSTVPDGKRKNASLSRLRKVELEALNSNKLQGMFSVPYSL